MDFKHIEVKLARATTLPILPHAVTQILGLPDDTDVTPRDFERIIVKDSALTVKILRTANSAYFNRSGEIASLQRAIDQLGMNTVRSICVASAFQSRVSSKSLCRTFNTSDYWKHSLSVACLAKVLASVTKYPRAEEAFIAGLFHDIGKMAIAMLLPEEGTRIYQNAVMRKISHYDAEQGLLEGTHQEIGLRAAELWTLPRVFWGPIANHHTPWMCEEPDPLTNLIHLANALAHQNGMGYAVAGEINAPDEGIMEALGVSAEQLKMIIAVVSSEITKLQPVFGLSEAKAA